jgi:LPS-assembly lipoprotein
MKILKIISSLLICFFISSCGWHMRGSSETAHITALNIHSAQSYGKLERELRSAMREQHIADSDPNAWNLIILNQDIRSNLLAYSDSINAAMTEIELVTHFTVTNNKGETIIAPTTERVVRPYEPNSNRALATDREAALMRSEAYKEMANNILRRIDFIAQQK